MCAKIVFYHTTSGLYTVRSGYQLLLNRHQLSGSILSPSLPVCPHLGTWKSIWSIPITPKLRFFIWRSFHNALHVLASLVKHGCLSDSQCKICYSKPETFKHLLFYCFSVRLIWFASPCAYKPVSTAFPCFLAQWEALLAQSKLDLEGLRLLTLSILTLQHIWKDSNHCVFDKILPDPMHVVSCILFDFS